LWLHYVLVVVVPTIIGFVGLSVLIGPGGTNGHE
jgi:hypothetical protein